MLPFLLFLLGINVGSFLNVCIWRLPRGESIVQPPSHCPNCNTRLRFLDLVPLLSQLWLRGRCRYCQARFSWRYFGIECLTGALFALVGAQYGLDSLGLDASVRLARDLVFMATLVVIFWVDYDTRLIQLESVFLLGLSGVSYDAWSVYRGTAPLSDGGIFAAFWPAPLPGSVSAMIVAASALWMLREIFSRLYGREALGFGDVMLVAAIAANLGWNATVLTFFFLAVIIGSVVGVGLQVPRSVRSYRWGKAREQRNGRRLAWPLARRAFRKGMPFGPMLAIGAVAALLFGTQINAFYWRTVLPDGAFAPR